MNISNALTVSRIFMVPVIALLLIRDDIILSFIAAAIFRVSATGISGSFSPIVRMTGMVSLSVWASTERAWYKSGFSSGGPQQ